MKMNIKGTEVALTEAIETYIQKRMAALDHYAHGDSAFAQFEVGKTSKHHKHGDVFRAEINLTLGGENYFAFSEKSDLYAAIDDVRDEILRRVRGAKDKKSSLLRRTGARIKDALRGIRSQK